MYNLILILHIIVAISLVATILIQRGRSGGLVEALGGVESIFGTKTSSFFVKMTVVLAILFFLTSISLAYISKQKGGSIMNDYQSDVIREEAEDQVQKEGERREDVEGGVISEVENRTE